MTRSPDGKRPAAHEPQAGAAHEQQAGAAHEPQAGAAHEPQATAADQAAQAEGAGAATGSSRPAEGAGAAIGSSRPAEDAGAARSIDPAALEMLVVAAESGIGTAFTRAEEMKPCPIGESGACCRICSMGPCRLVGKDAESKTGVCGADLGTVAARHFARQVAAGAAAHSDHGRDMAMALLAAAQGEAPGYQIRDEQKLMMVAAYLGLSTGGRSVKEIAVDVAETALQQFGQPHGEVLPVARATAQRRELWKKLGLTPRAIDREIAEVMHRTHEGVDLEPTSILKQALRCALADGWGGSMLSTDISDVLFGTPSPLLSEVNLGVLKSDRVNVVVHGHEPTLSAMIVEAARDPELIALARETGAQGINLAGICCTANEILMRFGIPPAGNFLHQELAVLTGAVEAMVVDVQCIMQALGPLTQRFHTKLITTSPKARIPGAQHIEFHEAEAAETAREIVRLAVENYPNRGPVHIPEYREDLVAGFSHEYLNYMQGGFHRGSFRPLNDAIIAGRVRGLAGIVGCNNARVTQDEAIVELIRNLIAEDVMVVATGCAATAGAKHGFLRPQILDACGPGLREVMEAIGIPPVLHLGSCVDNSRILTVLTQVATEGGVGTDIDDIPGVGICPEWMCEKALAIGTYFAASGVTVLFGVSSPVRASAEVTRVMSDGWRELVGGSLEFEPDWGVMLCKTLETIDAKREKIKLPPYDPSGFGASGDSTYFRAVREQLVAAGI
jgi:carbon-monoxide dehydrogenase catalytic subunit